MVKTARTRFSLGLMALVVALVAVYFGLISNDWSRDFVLGITMLVVYVAMFLYVIPRSADRLTRHWSRRTNSPRDASGHETESAVTSSQLAPDPSATPKEFPTD